MSAQSPAWGWTRCACARGDEALDALRKEAFTLVLMDVRLPGQDGLESHPPAPRFHKLGDVVRGCARYCCDGPGLSCVTARSALLLA